MQLQLHRFELPLKHVFTIARGSVAVQETLIVELEQDGVRGYGEATTNPYYNATWQGMAERLRQVRPQLHSADATQPEQLWDRLEAEFDQHRFALCALDQAMHDLCGKLTGQTVFSRWGYRVDSVPSSSFTIGIDDVEKMVEKLREVPDWPIYKIKLGTDHDLEIVRALRAVTDAKFRVDANCGWSVAQTIDMSHAMRELKVEFIEQPLRADNWEGMQQVFRHSSLPVIADESCELPADVERCHGYFHGVNVKAVKCGGLTPARRMLQQARQLGLRTMIGCMTESSVGISAIAQLLPLVDYADIDGAVLLSRDIAEGVRVEHGRCAFPGRYGSGVELIAVP